MRAALSSAVGHRYCSGRSREAARKTNPHACGVDDIACPPPPPNHAFGVDDGPCISFPFPAPFSAWVTSAERCWVTFFKRPRWGGFVRDRCGKLLGDRTYGLAGESAWRKRLPHISERKPSGFRTYAKSV
jgi:hypothetical protein